MTTSVLQELPLVYTEQLPLQVTLAIQELVDQDPADFMTDNICGLISMEVVHGDPTLMAEFMQHEFNNLSQDDYEVEFTVAPTLNS